MTLLTGTEPHFPVIHSLDLADHPKASFPDVAQHLILLHLADVRVSTRQAGGTRS